MDKKDIKEGAVVVDRWSPEFGTGYIKDVTKSTFKVVFGSKTIKYDYPHSQFLDVIVDEVKFDFMEDYVKFYIEESKRKYKTKKEIIDNTQIVLNNRGIRVTKKHIRELLNKND
jgi:hypothetical protein